ncbi:fimbrial biogenesis chaperone [Salinimonas chungwhensis]|uniref:molecular chaperone n=1 Tax=Salinimonas chungwhensis TaxID=265425 RepID=UPI0003676693|nr:molecular chaperone [Salinimonas chungwhensis]
MVRYLYLIATIMFCHNALAYKVEPMVAELEPIGNRSQMTMRIDNTSNKVLTVELYPFSMTMDEYGKETREPADGELLVIPVTAVIQPGRSQSVIVRYLGDPSITQSKAYRISVKEVQLESKKNNSGMMGLLFQFNTLINVKPKNTFSELNVEKISQKDDKWLLEVINSGDSYGRLTQTRWQVSDGANSLMLKGSDISKYIAGTLVLPQSKRVFEMTPIENYNASTVSIDILQD